MGWLLRLLVGEADRRAIESDLSELHDFRRRRDGADAADRWLRRQRRLYPWIVLLDHGRAALPGWTTMQHLWRDVRLTLRSLATVPALSATIVLTVGVGLGATVAALVLARTVLVDPLPYADPERLAWIYTDNPPYRFPFSIVDYRALEADHPAFSAVAAYQRLQITVADGDAAERVTARAVSGSYFPLLGQKPHVGRLFDAADDARDDRIVVLTYGYWTRRFGGDPSVLSRAVTIDGARATVVGVLQRTAGPLEHDVALFSAARWPTPTRKGPFFATVLGRLRPGVSATAAAQALRATNARLFPIWRSSFQNEKATWGLADLKTRVVGEVGSTLVFVLAAVVCVLLIACANAVNLLIARSLHRSRELAIRGALGATTTRLLQYVLVEACVLTAAAALVGLGVAVLALQVVAVYGADYVPRIDEVRFSATAFALAGRPGGGQRHHHRYRAGVARHQAAGRSGAADKRTIVDRRTDDPSNPTGAGGGGVRPRHAAARGRRAGPHQPRSADPRTGGHRHDAPAHRIGVIAARGLSGGRGSRGVLEARRRAPVRDSGRPERRALRQPAAERERAAEQLRSRGSPDARRPEPASVPLGRGVARLLQERRGHARARSSARRAIAPGGRGGRRPGLGGALLPRPGGGRPPLSQRWLHDLRVDDRRRRRRRRALDRPRRDRAGRHGLLSARGSAERLSSSCGPPAIRSRSRLCCVRR